MRHIVKKKKKKRKKKETRLHLNFKCVGFWNWCMCLFIYEQHPCVACICILSAAMKRCVEKGSRLRPPPSLASPRLPSPRLLSPRRWSCGRPRCVCKQTRGKLCMRTSFRQSYLFYVNTFSIRNQLCVFVTLCAHALASPRRSYLLECVQMCCCWWSAALQSSSSVTESAGPAEDWIQPAVHPEYRERAGQIQKCALRKKIKKNSHTGVFNASVDLKWIQQDYF